MTAKGKKILETYPLRIWLASNGAWKAHVPDATKDRGRRIIQANTKEILENKIIEDYESKKDNKMLFHNYFAHWLIDYKALTVQPPTIQRYRDDYNRFLNGTEIDGMQMGEIKKAKLKTFIHETILKFSLTRKALTNLLTLLRGVFEYALEEEDIDINPMAGMVINNTNIRAEKLKSSSTEIFNEEELDTLIGYIYEHYKDNRPVVTLAILLNFQLGLRVGELCALRKEDVDYEAKKLTVDRMERSYRPVTLVNGELVAERTIHTITEGQTKKSSNRSIDLSDEAIMIINEAIRLQESAGIDSEYLFADDNGEHIIRQRINDCLRYYCEKVAVDSKSSHKIRKTVLSNLFAKGFDFEEIMSVAGHRNKQTTYKYHLFSTKVATERQKRLSNALSTGHSFGQPTR